LNRQRRAVSPQVDFHTIDGIVSHMAIQSQAALDLTFHALGDGTRRQMLAMLSEAGSLSAKDLHAPFPVAQPTISKHIKVLERANLVIRKVEGRIHRFTINAEQLKHAEQWINKHRALWEGAFDQLDEFLANTDE